MTKASDVLKGVDLNSLRVGSLIDVETKSRHYRIENLGGNAIRISGHPAHCPRPEVAELYGSVNDEGVVEVGLVEPGMRLMFFLHDRPVTTSRVISVRID
jgi:hypothetical protein